MLVVPIPSSVSLPALLFTGGNAAHVCFILCTSAHPLSPLTQQFSGFNAGVWLGKLGGSLSKPVREFGCFAELSFYPSLLVSWQHSGVPAEMKAPLCEVLYAGDKGQSCP